MENKITIIEGPTPTFEPVEPFSGLDDAHAWTSGILEGPFLYDMAFTTLRTFDSQKLLNRCTNTWSQKQTMYLEYRDRIGLTKQSPILAARALSVKEGDMLLLWVRQEIHTDPVETDEDTELED